MLKRTIGVNAIMRDKSAVFSSIEMLEWLSKLETTPSLREDKKKIELYFDEENDENNFSNFFSHFCW